MFLEDSVEEEEEEDDFDVQGNEVDEIKTADQAKMIEISNEVRTLFIKYVL